MVTKNSRDIQGHALAIVLERMKPYGASHDTYEFARTISTGPSSKGGSKIGKANSYANVSKHGSRAVLSSDLMKYFREDLYRSLLSTYFKKQVDGIEMLQKALPSISKEITEVLDILLRWFVLRFCESNTPCLLKVQEFLPELFDTSRNEGYIMTESEAAIFCPCLFEKSGHNIEKVREKMRELTKQIIHTYSAAKTFPYVLKGLRSRNNRTRIECVDLVGYLLDNHGAEISGKMKSFQIVASFTSDRDGELRKAALNSLATGDDMWKYVGKLTEAQRSMIDDRFKWKAREMD